MTCGRTHAVCLWLVRLTPTGTWLRCSCVPACMAEPSGAEQIRAGHATMLVQARCWPTAALPAGVARTTADTLVVIMPSASPVVVPCTGAVPSARPALFSRMSTCAAQAPARPRVRQQRAPAREPGHVHCPTMHVLPRLLQRRAVPASPRLLWQGSTRAPRWGPAPRGSPAAARPQATRPAPGRRGPRPRCAPPPAAARLSMQARTLQALTHAHVHALHS